MGNVLDPIDQTAFDLWRVAGVTTQVQCVWVYNRPIDIDGLRQFHDHLQRGRLSRRIERSPLPFGRHRWISPDGSSDMEIVASALPREEFDAWLNEQANTPLDCEHGPGWHLAALPFTDGGAGVSLVISHCLTDAVGLCEALADAALGRDDPISWPAAASRRRWQALREDARQTARDTPAIGRAGVPAVRFARRSRGGAGAATPLPALPAGADEPITLPMATIFVDADEWEARAHALGGTSNALLVGLAARLAQRVGRVSADGSVIVRMPVNERAADDTRANAVSEVALTVNPAPATTDLREIRAAVKQALIRHQEVPDEQRAMVPLVPLLALVPRRLLLRLGGSDATSVSSSNLGVVNSAASRPDGTDADYFAMKNVYRGMTKAMMYRLGGLQFLLSGRARGQVFVSVTAYQPGRPTSNDGLRQDLSSALNDFSLTGSHL
jgi:diacylglycerol O-acyltransferase